MSQLGNKEATPDEWVVHHAKVWRDREKDAIGKPSDRTKRAEYSARQQLREAVDQLEKATAR